MKPFTDGDYFQDSVETIENATPKYPTQEDIEDTNLATITYIINTTLRPIKHDDTYYAILTRHGYVIDPSTKFSTNTPVTGYMKITNDLADIGKPKNHTWDQERFKVYEQTRDFTIAFVRKHMQSDIHPVFNTSTDFTNIPEFKSAHTNTHYLKFPSIEQINYTIKLFTIADLNPILIALQVHNYRIGP